MLFQKFFLDQNLLLKKIEALNKRGKNITFILTVEINFLIFIIVFLLVV